MDDLDNLVFSGGGVRGVSFCGAIMALHSLNQEHRSTREPPGYIPWVKRTAGASIGALFACAVALRISCERLFRLLDTEAILEGLVPSLNFQMLQQEFGLDNGKTMKDGVIRVLEVGLAQWGVDSSKASSFTFTDLMNLTDIHVSFSNPPKEIKYVHIRQLTCDMKISPQAIFLYSLSILSPHWSSKQFRTFRLHR